MLPYFDDNPLGFLFFAWLYFCLFLVVVQKLGQWINGDKKSPFDPSSKEDK